MRPVIISEWKKINPEDFLSKHEKVDAGPGKFHAWGVDYEQMDYGVGTYSTAIIELPNGEIQNCPADLIRFTD